MSVDLPQRSKVQRDAVDFEPLPESFIETTITARFKSIVSRYPERMAIVDRNSQLTYRALDQESNRLAEVIFKHCGDLPRPVALLLPQGAPAAVAIFGILKARMFYVPFDCAAQVDWLKTVLSEVRPAVVLTDDENLTLARSVSPAGVRVLDVRSVESGASNGLAFLRDGVADDIAYIFFTSGTTGRPKGVFDTHRNVLHNIVRYTNTLAIRPGDRMSLIQSPAFSGSVSSLFCALLNGACIFPIDLRRESMGSLATWLREQAVTIYHSVPTIFRGIAVGSQEFPSIRIVRLEGDRGSKSDLERFLHHFPDSSVIVNGLGTTETGLVSQYFMDRRTKLAAETLPIGFPAPDMQIRILDENGDQLPSGSVGEIAVTSRYLATGYWRRPNLTEAAFQPSIENPGDRTYRTGDLGRIAEDGSLEHLGRVDSKVRLRGQWVLPAVVEEALGSCPGVDQAAVTVRGEIGNERLVAFYTQSSARQPDVGDLREQVRSQLPTYSVPSRFVSVKELPVSSNGKVDRSALPQLDRARPNLSTSFVEPYSPVHRKLVELWCDVLRLDQVGVRDDFFELGGDSLGAVHMLTGLEIIIGRQLSPDILIDNSTIEKLTEVLVRDEKVQAESTILNAEGELSPLFFLHGDYTSGGLYVRELAHHLGSERPVVAIRPCGLWGESIPPTYTEMAKIHLSQIRDVQPEGPYLLAGQCNGGLVAYEMARLLAQQGETVSRVILIHASASNLRYQSLRQHLALRFITSRYPKLADRVFLWVRGRLERKRQGQKAEHLRLLFLRSIKRAVLIAIRSSSFLNKRLRGESSDAMHAANLSVLGNHSRLRRAYLRIDHLYLPSRYDGSVVLLWPKENREETLTDLMSFWKQVCEEVDLRQIPGSNNTCLTKHVDTLAQAIEAALIE